MRKGTAGYAAWMVLAGLLYFFENNTGTRAVLAGTLLLPLIPAVRRAWNGPDESAGLPGKSLAADDAASAVGEEVPGGVRTYLPGDPVNRIHWKLSAKRDELLIREPETEETEETAEKPRETGEDSAPVRPGGKRAVSACLAVCLTALILLLAVPPAAQGLKALLNRLFDASEKVNAYSYERFDVPPDQSAGLAAALLAAAGLSLLGTAGLAESRLPALLLMAGAVLFQAYFGLAFPGWLNATLFAAFAIRLMKRPRTGKAVLSAAAGILALTLAVLLFWPGTDAATEKASENLRDLLSRMAQSASGTVRELPEGENEVRRSHNRRLAEGNREARTDGEYRLLTAEEKQISMPRWVNWLRIMLLLLLTAVLLILPFLPFILMNRRQKKAMEARAAFRAENAAEAVAAIFQHVTACLEATGHGGGNLPYAAWQAELSPGYAARFAACEKLFEEAAYSTHGMGEEQRAQALELLEETERILWQEAGWKQRLRLRYGECLWI